MYAKIRRVNASIYPVVEPHKNLAVHVSDQRAIGAFIEGIRRRDIVQELGRANPKTFAELMDIANKWADGEDVVHNKRTRAPKEDRSRNNSQNMPRFRNFG
jgi:hypothetical protein